MQSRFPDSSGDLRVRNSRSGTLPLAFKRPVLGELLEAQRSPNPASVPLAKRWAPRAARSRIAVSILLAAAACWLARPTHASVLAGAPVALLGLTIRAWAAGHLRKNQQLAVSGPYAHVRNPLYIGSLFVGAGFGLAANHITLLVAIVAVFLIWFLPVVSEEEDHIRKILPGYAEYENRVRRFVPSLAPQYESGARFDLRLYLKNREYSALVGFLAFMLVLWIKLQLL